MKKPYIAAFVPSRERAMTETLDLLNDGRSVLSINLHRIIDRLAQRTGLVDDPEVAGLRAKTAAVMLLTAMRKPE